jgi:cephalosporin hydroxylase
MSHPEQLDFFQSVKSRHPELFSEVSVLEVGSLDINGSVRQVFDNTTRYIGVDLAEGPGVDMVKQGQHLNFAEREFDVAVSAECFEHNPWWVQTFTNMCRMSDAAVIFTCASTGRPEHGTAQTTPGDSPFTVAEGWDYYRNLTSYDFTSTFDLSVWFSDWEFSYNPTTCDLYFYGIRNSSNREQLDTSEKQSVFDLWKSRFALHTSKTATETYRGRPLIKFPEDLRVYQSLIEKHRPEVIVELGSYAGGSALWFADQMRLFCDTVEVHSVDVMDVEPSNIPGVVFHKGSVDDRNLAQKIAKIVNGRACMVVEDSAHTYHTTSKALELYSNLVTGGQWFVVEDTVVDYPELRLENWPLGVVPAINDFMRSHSGRRFTRHNLAPYTLTCHPYGWLQSDTDSQNMLIHDRKEDTP